MLKSLHVRNYTLIDSLDVTFPAGLVIITGQTGAGKSILLGALSLCLGGKADSGMVGQGADNCVVEALFEVSGDTLLEELFTSRDLPWNGGEILLRRVLGKSGRSRSFVNDEPVQVGVLSQMASRLIDIHSQHQTLLLSDKAFQLSMLDHYADNTALLGECSTLYHSLQGRKKELLDVVAKLQRQALERDYNQASFDRLDKASLRQGELEELEAEQKKLANAEEIRENLQGALEAVSPSDDNREEVSVLLKEAGRLLDRTSSFVPSVGELSARLASVRLELEDIVSELEDIASGIEVAPERLEEVEDRMGELYDLMKKHGCTSIEELIAVRDALGETLFDSTALEQRRSELQKEISSLQVSLDKVCRELHDRRAESARPFSQALQSSIRSLELDKAVFDVVLAQGQVGEKGSDEILFRFSSTGHSPVDIAKCASGGEMSRIMLCLKAMMARYTSMPSMIFDEIDTGVSGSVADKMGSMICSMGEDMQVFAITHLPQVAAKGNAHYLVSKDEEDGRTISRISLLDRNGRIDELARMLSGATVTKEALANAVSLLGE